LRQTLQLAVQMFRSTRNPMVPPAALVMIGLILMEHAVTRDAIVQWLHELAESYDSPPDDAPARA
jgi:hypothetical protein